MRTWKRLDKVVLLLLISWVNKKNYNLYSCTLSSSYLLIIQAWNDALRILLKAAENNKLLPSAVDLKLKNYCQIFRGGLHFRSLHKKAV